MRVGLVPSITIGTVLQRDVPFYADVPRGAGLEDIIVIEVNGRRLEISGAQLRAALLSTVHTGPWDLAPIGGKRFALRLDPDGRSSTIAHLDAQGISNPKYWLYRRGEDGPVNLTRWTRAGRTSRKLLLEQAGFEPVSMTNAACERALDALVSEGLPRALEVTRRRTTPPVLVEAPDPGWLDIEPGALKARPDRIPIHQVDDLGPWPNDADR